ncbi:MAG: HupE/UreJ family protein [Parvibaculaceae bacterium]|nr:HupE/UreJ family protein [Parvibaculaceae bacterium]
MRQLSRLFAFTAPMLLIAAPAMAHPGHGVNGFSAGFIHPLTGADHLLAMVAVGLWAGLAGNRSLWVWPASFVTAMIAGGVLGMSGLAIPAVETVILLSVVVLGVATALNLKLHIGLGAALIAAFGLAHGYAHGLEIPASASGMEFATGFTIATALLHGCGLGVALATRRISAEKLTRAVGAIIALAGLGMIFA